MRPVARSLSPIFAAEMKLSFRSKLIALTTPGLSVRRDRPMAESASVLIIPPWTKPAWLAMSSVGVISTVAVPSAVSTVSRASHVHNRDPFFPSLTPLPPRHGHAGGGGPSHEAAALVDHLRLAEEERLLHLHHAADRANASRDDGADEIDLELDGGVPHAVLLQGRKGHPHRSVRDLGDHATLDHAAAVAVLRSGFELEDDAAWLSLGDASAKGRHPPVWLGSQQAFGALDVPHRPRRPR